MRIVREPELEQLNRQWVPLPRWEGIYEIHPDGYVRRVAKSSGAQSGRILLGTWAGAGYHAVTLRRKSRIEREYVHRLVLTTFKGPCPPGHEGEHLDRNKRNNADWNLEWKTHRDNCFNRDNKLTGKKNAKLTIRQVRMIKRALGKGTLQKHIAARFGVCKQTVTNIKQGKAHAYRHIV